MPLYDLKCEACGHKYEDIKPISSEPPYKCPQCGKHRVSRVFNVSGITMRTDRGLPNSARFNRGRLSR